MTAAFQVTCALLATAVTCILPGWPLARRLSPDTVLLGAVVLSLATLFSGCLLLSFAGLRIGAGSVAIFQVGLAVFGGWLGRRHRNPLPTSPPREAPPRWIALIAVIVGLVLLIRGWLQPLPGYDTCFRWGRLAREIFSTGGIDYYPARAVADYARYFYPDSIPPLVSFTYAEIYSLLQNTNPAATAWFVALQGMLLAMVSLRLAQLWGGPRAGPGALLAICACPLLFWCVLMGQESGLTALSLSATILWLEQSAKSGRAAESVLAGLATGLGAVSREYGGAFAVVGLVTALGLRLGRRRILLYAATTTLIAAPWYLRVWHLTGNPFYPLRVGSLFPFSAVHAAMFDELRARFSWSALPTRERLRVGYQLLQLAPLAIVGGVAGLWMLRRRAPWLILGIAVSISLWLYGMGVVAGGTYISLRMWSPALVLLAAAAGVAFANFRQPRPAFTVAAGVTALVLPNILTMPLMAKSIPVRDWFAAFARNSSSTAITPGERLILDLPGRILSDDPYVHSWIADRGAGGKVVPVWSAEVAFLFDGTVGVEEQLHRLLALDIRTVVLWPDVPVTAPLLQRSWAQRIRAEWPQVAPGYYHHPSPRTN